MSVIRIKKARDKPFVILDTTALNDPRLSFRAKGLHTYLMAKPDDWQVHVEQLEKQSPKEAREAIRAALAELEACGYIRRQRIRGEKGRMMGWDTTVYETPILASMDAEDAALRGDAIGLSTDQSPTTDYPKSDEPTSARPTSDEPTSVQPTSANPQLLNIDTTQNREVPSIEKKLEYTDSPTTSANPVKPLPLSKQPGEIDPDLRQAVLAMEVSEFHCLGNETKLNERFWNAQIKLVDSRRLVSIYTILREVDAYYAGHPEKLPVNEKSARSRMGFGVKYTLDQAHKRGRRHA